MAGAESPGATSGGLPGCFGSTHGVLTLATATLAGGSAVSVRRLRRWHLFLLRPRHRCLLH